MASTVIVNIIKSATIFVFIVILIPTFIVPFFILRQIVNLARLCFRRDLVKIIPATSAYYLRLGIEREEANNILLVCKCSRLVQYEEVSRRLILNLIKAADKDNQLLYPELQMYSEFWCGYPFWKREIEFQIQNHLFQHSMTFYDDDDVSQYIAKFEPGLVNKAFKDQLSPWEVHLVHVLSPQNCQDRSYSYIYFKAHHSLIDGYGMFEILRRCCDDNESISRYKAPPTSETMVRFWSRPIWYLTIPFRICYAFAQLDELPPKAIWSTPIGTGEREEIQGQRIYVKSNSLIPCSAISAQRKANHVSFTSVIISAITAAIGFTIKQNGQEAPCCLPTCIPVPLPGHKGKLSNIHSVIHVGFPTRYWDNETRRFYESERELQRAKGSTIPLGVPMVLGVMGTLPRYVRKWIPSDRNTPLLLQSFPGPQKTVYFTGIPLTQMYFTLNASRFTAILISILSYNGNIQLYASADPNYFPNNEAVENFLAKIEKFLGTS